MVWNAVEAGDLDSATEEILAWHPLVETHDLEEDDDKRTSARQFDPPRAESGASRSFLAILI